MARWVLPPQVAGTSSKTCRLNKRSASTANPASLECAVCIRGKTPLLAIAIAMANSIDAAHRPDAYASVRRDRAFVALA